MSVSWQDRLDDASNVHDVIEITRDFLATWDRHEIAALPEACRPGKVFDANDVTTYAFQLMQADCAGDSQCAALVQRMMAFFSNASVRMTQILAAPSHSGEGESRSAA